MKKFYLLFVLIVCFGMLSCEKEVLEFEEKNELPLQTRATLPANILDQLNGIPVNIKLVGEPSYPYLSAQTSGININLYSKDDGSKRQRWNIKKAVGTLIPDNAYEISITGGTKYDNSSLSPNGVLPNKVTPCISPMGAGRTLLKRIPNTDYYYLYNEMAEFGAFPTSPYYLHSEKAKGRDLKYSLQSGTGGRDRWEIIPIEDFELTDISYAFVTGDKINLNPVYVRTEELKNEVEVAMTKNFTVKETFNETSSFSKVEGMSVANKISATISIGLPDIVDGALNGDRTTSKNWSYTVGGTTSKSREITDVFSVEVPAKTIYKVDCFIYTYDIDITYVATLRGKSTGRIIKMPGRWRGQEATHIYFRLYNANNNKLINTTTRALEIIEQ